MNSRYIIGAALIAVIVFAGASVVSAREVNAAPNTREYCRTCHPTAHPGGWGNGHATDLRSDPEASQSCGGCHPTTFCTTCHTQDGVSR